MASNYVSTADLAKTYTSQQSSYTKTTESEDASTQLAGNYQTFLTMLTTQLQNQDPLSPMDSTQFTQQLVAFSGVEQQIAANDKLEELLSLQKLSGASTVLGYIGKEVEAESTKLALAGDSAKMSYELSDSAEKVSVVIKDKSGQTVRTLEGGTTLGRNEVEWDGKNEGGTELPKGTYTMTATYTDSEGNSKSLTTRTIGTVTAIETTTDGAMLSISGLQVDANYIIAIRTPDEDA